MKAHDILKQAAGLVAGDRARQHGSKVANHNNIADLWTAYLGNRLATRLEARDIALMMVLLKVARTKTGNHNPDDYLDMAGYAGCAGEIADAEHPVGVCVPLSPEVEVTDSSGCVFRDLGVPTDTDSRITREHTHSRIQPDLSADCERQWPEPQADGPRRNVASFPPPFTQR